MILGLRALAVVLLLASCGAPPAPPSPAPPVATAPAPVPQPATFLVLETRFDGAPLTVREVGTELRVTLQRPDGAQEVTLPSRLDSRIERQPCPGLVEVHGGEITTSPFVAMGQRAFVFTWYYEALDRVVAYAVGLGLDGSLHLLREIGPMGFVLADPSSRQIISFTRGFEGKGDDFAVLRVDDDALHLTRSVTLDPREHPLPAEPFASGEAADAWMQSYQRYLAGRLLGDQPASP